MTIRAVLFDYGKVLSGPADPACHAQLCRLTGLVAEQFEPLYWAQPDRRAYDIGLMTGLEYWRRFAQRIGLTASEATIAQLTQLDARLWTTENPAMIGWSRQLRQAGIRTGILSNMGDAISANILASQSWVHEFDVLVWSWELKFGKPEPASYLHALKHLQTEPQETLFIDDRPANVEPAAALGLETHLFSTVEALTDELRARQTDWALPIPQESAQ